MSIQKSDIEHLATLARIRLDDREAEHLAKDIDAIVEYVSEINEITGSGHGEKQTGPLYNVMREDGEPHEEGMYTQNLLESAPDRQGDYVRVKKILGGE